MRCFGKLRTPFLPEECCMSVFSSLSKVWHVPCCSCCMVTCSYWACCPQSLALMLWLKMEDSQSSNSLTSEGYTHYMWARLESAGPAGPCLNQQAQPGHACTSRPSWARFTPAGHSTCVSTDEPKNASPKGSLQVAFLSWRPGEAKQGPSYTSWW